MVKWGEFKVIDVFKVRNTHCILSSEIAPGSGTIPYLCASAENNAVSSYVDYRADLKEPGNCIFIGGKTFVVSYQESDFFSNDSHNLALYLNDEDSATKPHLLFMASCIARSLGHKYTWGDSISKQKIKNDSVSLPVTPSGEIDFAFMDSFIRELEEERIRELAAYLKVSGLADSKLSASERKALDQFWAITWREYNVKCLFGDSTRGKRLKSDDRIPGTLPFVTAGEAEQGVSAFIGNNVEVFKKNTTTIDMFGSAKYRNCEYGADDHVAVVHTEKLPNHAATFVTASCHKAAHTGAFDYGRNFYARDADALNIMLPSLASGLPDYGYMETFMRAVQKLVVKDVADFAAKRISATKQCAKGGSRVMMDPADAPEEEESFRLAADENGE